MLRSLGFGRCRDKVFLDNIPVYQIDMDNLTSAYPMPGRWYAPSGASRQRWAAHFRRYRPDKRKPIRAVDVFDLIQLHRVIEKDESAVFVDKNIQQPLLIVIRDWVRDPELVEFFNSVSEGNVAVRRNVRVRFLSHNDFFSFPIFSFFCRRKMQGRW
jgi:hypothetical protein